MNQQPPSQPPPQQPPPPGYGPPPPPPQQPPPGYGPPPPQYGAPGAQLPQGTAVASLVLGLLSFFCIGILGAIPAVILGNSALNKIRAGQETGEGMAKTGVVLGWINIGLTILGVLIWIIVVAAAGTSVSTG